MNSLPVNERIVLILLIFKVGRICELRVKVKSLNNLSDTFAILQSHHLEVLCDDYMPKNGILGLGGMLRSFSSIITSWLYGTMSVIIFSNKSI